MNELADKDRLNYELLIENIADGLIVTGKNGCIVFANHAAEMLMGAKRDELVGTPFAYPLVAGDGEDIEIRDVKGNNVVAEMRIAHLATGEKELRLISLRDVTSVKRVEDKLPRSYREAKGCLDESEEARQDLKDELVRRLEKEMADSINMLAAGVSREIGIPLSFISSNLGVLKKYVERITEFTQLQDEIITTIDASVILDELSEKRRKFKIDHIVNDIHSLLSESIEGSERLKGIIHDLRFFSQLNKGEYELCDINEALDTTIRVVLNEVRRRPAVAKEFGDIPCTMCDMGRLNQAFMNVLVNAVDAIDEDGEIRVKTEGDEDTIYISVTDTGCGIPAEDLDRIFDPFFTTKEVGAATGLGLSVARMAVERHDGDMTIRSERGSGSTCIMKIPVR